jgi:hypothetical protein
MGLALFGLTASSAKAQTDAQLADSYASYAYLYAYEHYTNLVNENDGTIGGGPYAGYALDAYLDTYYGAMYADMGAQLDPYFFSLAVPYLYNAYTTEYQEYVNNGDVAAYDAFYYAYCAYYFSYVAYYG